LPRIWASLGVTGAIFAINKFTIQWQIIGTCFTFAFGSFGFAIIANLFGTFGFAVSAIKLHFFCF
jgi:hypothetical protein